MKLISASVLAFLCILLTPATFANTAPEKHCQLYANPQLCHAEIYKEGSLRLKEVNAEDAQARQAYNANWYIGIGGLILTLAMLVAAIIAAIYAKRSARAVLKSVEDNEKYSKIQTRAYIGATVQIVDFKTGKTPVFCIILTNHGNTPANNIKIEFGSLFTEIKPNKLDYDNLKYEKETYRILFPKQSTYETDDFKFELTVDTRNELESCKKYYYSYGIVSYYDIFGGYNYTEFCAYVKTREVKNFEGPLNSTDRHNSAT